jgi:hypothetical protein
VPKLGLAGPDEQGVPVQPDLTRSVLILPARELPAGAQPVDLSDLLARLRQDPATRARVIGDAQDPDALAATLSEDQIEALNEMLEGRVRIVDDTPIDLDDPPIDF